MFGRLALILYIFAGVLLIVGYMIFQAFGFMLFDGWTGEALNELVGANELSVEERPDLIFGNFFGTAQAILTLLLQGTTGGIIQDTFGAMSFSNDAVMILIRFLYTFSGFMLGVHLLTGRGL